MAARGPDRELLARVALCAVCAREARGFGYCHGLRWDRHPYHRFCSRRCQDARFIIVVRGTTYKVARLVAEAFHGPAPFDRAVVMHLDENAANNRADNLAWGTQRENLNAPGFLEYCRGRAGDRHPVAVGKRRRARS